MLVYISRVDAGHDEMVRLYGRWAGRTPEDVVGLLETYPGHWWVAGGWSLEAFTSVTRTHDDCDPSVLRAELPLLRRHLAGRLDLWSASRGSLRPLLPDDRPGADAAEVLPEGCSQVWTRASAADPWEFDILLAPGDAGTWVYRRDPAPEDADDRGAVGTRRQPLPPATDPAPVQGGGLASQTLGRLRVHLAVPRHTAVDGWATRCRPPSRTTPGYPGCDDLR